MTLQVRAQVSLKPFNSFGIDVRARLFAEAHSDADVREALACAAAQALPLLVIGGGSNLLLTQDISALVLRMATQGIRVLHDDGVHVVVEAEAGEAWHPFVLWTLAQGFCGLENLSLIPGTVGAAPMQNIGAYGVEIKDVFAGLTALDRQTGELREFTLQECNFAYRDSLFKHETGRWLILRVRFALSRASHLVRLRPGATTPGRAGDYRGDAERCQPRDLQHPQRKTAGPGRAGQCRQLLQEPVGTRGPGRKAAGAVPGSGGLPSG